MIGFWQKPLNGTTEAKFPILFMHNNNIVLNADIRGNYAKGLQI